jgi:hypothetical protein
VKLCVTCAVSEILQWWTAEVKKGVCGRPCWLFSSCDCVIHFQRCDGQGLYSKSCTRVHR